MALSDPGHGIREEEDVKLLLESLEYQRNDPSHQQDGLKALAVILSENSNAQELFRLSNGLEYILNLLRIVKNGDVCHSALNVLAMAVEGNNKSRRALTTNEIFVLLRTKVLGKNKMVATMASFLLLTICTNNNEGQHLARETKCLHILCELFKGSLPVDRISPANSQMVDVSIDDSSLQLWNCVAVALVSLLQNPQNVENQRVVCRLLPVIVKILQSSTAQLNILRFTTTLVVALTSGNSECQSKMRLLGGLRALISLLRKHLLEKSMINDLSCVEHVVNTIGSAIATNVICQESAAEMGLISLLLKCLEIGHSQAVSSIAAKQFRTKCILALSACVDHSERTQEQLRNNGGMAFLIELLTFDQSEEFKRVTVFVLHRITKNCQVNEKILQHLPFLLTRDAACDAETQTEKSPSDTFTSWQSQCIGSSKTPNTSGGKDCTSSSLVGRESCARRSCSLSVSDDTEDCEACNRPLNSKTFLPTLRTCSNLCSYHSKLGQFLYQNLCKWSELERT